MSLHWDNVVKTLEYIVKKPDNDGLCELHFTSSGFSMKGQNRAEELVSIVKAHERKEGAASDINLRLASILEEYSRKLEEKGPFGKGSGKPMRVFILTDGVWVESSSAEERIAMLFKYSSCFKELHSNMHSAGQFWGRQGPLVEDHTRKHA